MLVIITVIIMLFFLVCACKSNNPIYGICFVLVFMTLIYELKSLIFWCFY